MTDIGDVMNVSYVKSQLSNTQEVSDFTYNKTRAGNHVFHIEFVKPLSDDQVDELFEETFEQYDAEYRYEGEAVETWDSLTMTIKNDLI